MDGAHKIKGEASQCLVCCHPAGSCHFGSVSCLACAAFFRRTVSLNIVFVCKKEKSCSVFHELRMICRACRFEQCLAAGLRRDLVQQRRLARRKSSVCQRKETVIKATREHSASSSSSLPPNSILSNMTSPEEQHLSPVYENIGTEESVPSSSSILSPSPQDESPPSSNTTDTSAVPLPILGMDGPDLLEHYRKELQRSMDRRCVMFTDNPMRAIHGTYGAVPYTSSTRRPHTMLRQLESQKFDHLLAFEYCQTMPGFNQMNDDEKLIFFRMATLSFCLLDIAWITIQTTTPEQQLLVYTDGSVSSVVDLSVGWDDEEGLGKLEKSRLFFEFVSRFHLALVLPLFEYGVDDVEYAALKAFCVWKMGYVEYSQNMRSLGKAHEIGLLMGLDRHYEGREDRAERLGNIILLMGTIFEMYQLILETYQSIDVFNLLKIDNISKELLTL